MHGSRSPDVARLCVGLFVARELSLQTAESLKSCTGTRWTTTRGVDCMESDSAALSIPKYGKPCSSLTAASSLKYREAQAAGAAGFAGVDSVSLRAQDACL